MPGPLESDGAAGHTVQCRGFGKRPCVHLGFVAASGRLGSIKCGAVTAGGVSVSLTTKIYPRALVLTPGVV